jgi:S1-C subfamily serine protease
MFIPIDRLKPILPDLLATGHSAKPARPWLGLFTEEVSSHLFIAATIPDGPSAQAGLRPGDIILGVGDKTVSSQAEFYRAVWAQGDAGVEIPLKILRQSQIQTLSIRSLDRDQYFQQNQSPGIPHRIIPPRADTAQSARWPALTTFQPMG